MDEAGTRDRDCVAPLRPSLQDLHSILHEQGSGGGVSGKSGRAQQERARTLKRSRQLWAAQGQDAANAESAGVDTAGDMPTLK
eukprot:1861420-Karenia_brevis.AAC.1